MTMRSAAAIKPTVGLLNHGVNKYLENISSKINLLSTDVSNMKMIQPVWEANDKEADQTTSTGEKQVGEDRINSWETKKLFTVTQVRTDKREEKGGFIGWECNQYIQVVMMTLLSTWKPPWPPPSSQTPHQTIVIEVFNDSFNENGRKDVIFYNLQRIYTAGDDFHSREGCQRSKDPCYDNDFDSDESADSASTAGFGKSYAPPSEMEVVGRML